MKSGSNQKAREMVGILDALDECSESRRYQIIDTLSALYKSSTSSRSGSQLKFLVTSRPYFDIERRFVDIIRNFLMIHLHGEHESEVIRYEINMR